MAKARSYIYLEGREELGDILDLITNSKDEEIILVVPSNFKVLKHPKNLEIFKRELERIGKKVYLDSEDKEFLNLASDLGFEIFLKDFVSTIPKIIDVKPPQPKTLKEKQTSQVKVTYKAKPPSFVFNLRILKKIALVLLGGGLIYLGGSFLLGLLQTKAVITVTLEKKSEDFSEIITLKDGITEVDFQNKILPAKKIVIEKAVSEEIEPTGVASQKEFLPNLKVVFYNKLNNSFPLIQGTRLEYEGNIFRTTQRIVLEEGSQENPSQNLGEAMPFEIKDNKLFIPKGTRLKIVALEGKEYEKGKLWSEVLYAEAYEDYRPQISQEVKLVTPNDLSNLKLKLEKKIKEVLKGEVALLYPHKYYLDDDSLYSFKILNISHQPGEKTEKISGLIQGKFETMIVDAKELENLIRNLAFEKLGEEKEMFMIDKLEPTSISLVDYDFKKNEIKVAVKAKIYLLPNLSEEIIKNQIRGKTIQEVSNYFAQVKGITKTNIKIWPAWRDRLPQDPSRIKIILE